MKAGLVVDSTPDDPSVYLPGGYEEVPYNWAQGFATSVDESFRTSIGPSGYRWADRHFGEDDSPMLSKEEANAKYGIPDQLSFDTYERGISERTAQELRTAKQQEIRQQSIVRRSGLGWLGRMTSGLIGGAADPANIVLAVAPELALTRLGLLGEGATLAARVRQGAMVGAAGNAPAIPFNYLLARDEQRDYGVADALMDLTVGAAIGGAAPLLSAGARGIFGRVRDRIAGHPDTLTTEPAAIASATPENRLETLATALQQKVNGLPVDLEPVLRNKDVIASADAAEFRQWFEGSKAVDADGTPTRVFHGTSKAFDEFNDKHFGTGTGGASSQEGFFFTNVPGLAGRYGTPRDWENAIAQPGLLNRMTGGRIGKVEYPSGPNVRPAYLSMKNPKIADTDMMGTVFPGEKIRAAKAEGYDGLILRDTSNGGRSMRTLNGEVPAIYIPFKAEQIRSSIGADTSAIDGRTLKGQLSGEATTPGQSTDTPQPSVSEPRLSVIRPDDASALARAEEMLAAGPTVKARAPDEGMGSSTIDTRELDELAAQDEQAVGQLRQAGRLTEADENALALNTAEDKVRKERSKARDLAYTCLAQNGEGEFNG